MCVLLTTSNTPARNESGDRRRPQGPHRRALRGPVQFRVFQKYVPRAVDVPVRYPSAFSTPESFRRAHVVDQTAMIAAFRRVAFVSIDQLTVSDFTLRGQTFVEFSDRQGCQDRFRLSSEHSRLFADELSGPELWKNYYREIGGQPIYQLPVKLVSQVDHLAPGSPVRLFQSESLVRCSRRPFPRDQTLEFCPQVQKRLDPDTAALSECVALSGCRVGGYELPDAHIARDDRTDVVFFFPFRDFVRQEDEVASATVSMDSAFPVGHAVIEEMTVDAVEHPRTVPIRFEKLLEF